MKNLLISFFILLCGIGNINAQNVSNDSLALVHALSLRDEVNLLKKEVLNLSKSVWSINVFKDFPCPPDGATVDFVWGDIVLLINNECKKTLLVGKVMVFDEMVSIYDPDLREQCKTLSDYEIVLIFIEELKIAIKILKTRL